MNKVRVARKDIVAYKQFLAGREARSPLQYYNWGILRQNQVLYPGGYDGFCEADAICCGGIHAFTSLIAAENALPSCNMVIWQVVIPKGTRYYRATAADVKSVWSSPIVGTIVRAAVLRLVRRVAVRPAAN